MTSEIPFNSINELITRKSPVQETLRAITSQMLKHEEVALARIWLIEKGDICETCVMRPECPNQSCCLHLTASIGKSLQGEKVWAGIEGKFKRFPIGVRKIGFVGESATGSAIMAQGSKTLKRVHFELGGKNPVIVFDDADLDRALDAVVFMIYSLNGERCTSSSRLLVQQSIAEKFVEKLVARVQKLKVGHPLDPATEIGPLIHERHLAKVCSYFDVARKDGATIAVGGRVHDGLGGGHYVQPTLVTNASPKMRVAQEEVFGPFLTVITFRDEADAVEIANNVQYGLTGYVWTGDMGRALRVADALEAGMIWLNSENVRHLPTPFGGMKASGIGRDGGDYSFDFYMETKHVSLARGTHKIQKLGL